METIDLELSDENFAFINDPKNFTQGELPDFDLEDGGFYLWWGENKMLYMTTCKGSDETKCAMWKVAQFNSPKEIDNDQKLPD